MSISPRIWSLLCLCCLPLACANSRPSLSVELMTDLRPGVDFDRIGVELSEGTLSGSPACPTDAEAMLVARADYREGHRVGAPRKVDKGETWSVRIVLCRGDVAIVHRTVRQSIESTTELRVVISNDCLIGRCAGQAPCNYTRCEPDIDCHWGNLTACENRCSDEPERCGEGLECVAGECLQKSCDEDAGTDAGPADESDSALDGGAGDAQSAEGDASSLPDGGADAEAETFGPDHKARVLYLGDAVAAHTADMVTWWTVGNGAVEVQAYTAGRVAPCDFLEGLTGGVAADRKLAQAMRSVKPHVVALQFWGDALTPCMSGVTVGSAAYYERYAQDGQALLDVIAQTAEELGIARPKVLWVLQGPDRHARARPERLNQIYSMLAERNPATVPASQRDRVSDAGKEVSMAANLYENSTGDRYEWHQFSPCNKLEQGTPGCQQTGVGPVVRLHAEQNADAGIDAFEADVLFCLEDTTPTFGCPGPTPSPGLQRYGLAIAADINRWLGLGT